VVRKVLRLSGWTVGFAASNQIAYLIVLTIARGVSPGAVSAYNYAFIFFQLPYGLIAVSIMTAVLPELAEAAKAHDVVAFRERFREGLSVLLTFLLPAAGAFLFLGVPLIRILLERGQFTAADTRLTAEMLAGFSLGLPSFAIFMYCVRAFYSRRNTRTPFWLNLFENVLNLVLIVPLVGLVGTWGLALANSVAYFVASILAVVVLNRHVHGTLTLRGLSAFLRGLVVAVVVTAVVFVVFLAPPRRAPVADRVGARGGAAGLPRADVPPAPPRLRGHPRHPRRGCAPPHPLVAPVGPERPVTRSAAPGAAPPR
jgi:putative peptidoglycan lipid II flippase